MSKKLILTLIVVLALAFGTTAVGAQDTKPVVTVGDTIQYIGTQNLNVRTGPSTSNGAAGHLAPNTQIVVLEVKPVGADIWFRHDTQGVAGWSAWLYNGTYTSFTMVSHNENAAAVAAAASSANTYVYLPEVRTANLIAMNASSSNFKDLMLLSGMTATTVQSDARQPEEETLLDSSGAPQVLQAGKQVTVTGLKVVFPACFTTDQKVNGISFSYQPDLTNPSKLYTNNMVGFSGQATVYYDCSNWGQLGQMVLDAKAAAAPAVNAAVVPAAGNNVVTVPNAGCPTYAELVKLGTNPVPLTDKNMLSGVQITLSAELVALPGWTLQMNGQTVDRAVAASRVSYWSDPTCRPLLTVSGG